MTLQHKLSLQRKIIFQRKITFEREISDTVADPGGVSTHKGVNLLFCIKLHEKRKTNWTRRVIARGRDPSSRTS